MDFDDLSPQLQREFQLVQARATSELGPLALERAVQMQRIVQAESYADRLDLLRECVDNERRRLEAKKMLRSLESVQSGSSDAYDLESGGSVASSFSRKEARSIFERLMTTSSDVEGSTNKQEPNEDEGVFQ